MPLSEEEKKVLEELQRKSKEPAAPTPNVNFTLDLSSDSAWERAKQLGIVKDPPPADEGNGDGGGDGGDPPKRRGFFPDS